MTKCKREITKEQYDRIMEASNGKGFVPDNIVDEFFNASVVWGYGLYGTSVAVEDGKYVLYYTIGDSCE